MYNVYIFLPWQQEKGPDHYPCIINEMKGVNSHMCNWFRDLSMFCFMRLSVCCRHMYDGGVEHVVDSNHNARGGLNSQGRGGTFTCRCQH